MPRPVVLFNLSIENKRFKPDHEGVVKVRPSLNVKRKILKEEEEEEEEEEGEVEEEKEDGNIFWDVSPQA